MESKTNGENNLRKKKRKPGWVFPWGYPEAFLIMAAVLLVGFAMEWVTPGDGLSAPAWPWNGVIGAALILGALILQLALPKNPVVRWLSQVPASMGAIAAVTLSVLLMGLFLQGQPSGISWIDRLGLTRMATSWPFLLSISWFLFVLAMTTVRRSIPLRGRNIGFLLNHLGLWIVIAGGILGSGDLQRVTMTLSDGQTVWYGTDRDGRTVELPLALELQRFHMEEYPPKMGMLDHDTGSLIIRGEQDLVEVERGRTGYMSGWNYEILRFFSESARIDDRFEPIHDIGAAPAAQIRAVHAERGDTVVGWITCGSFNMRHQFLELEEGRAMAMTVPQSKRYMSLARLYTQSGDNRMIDIEVNHPYSAGGWKLYQFSYDDRFGKWSPISIIEAVRDPWLPVVYTGFIMMLLGAVYLFWLGKDIGTELTQKTDGEDWNPGATDGQVALDSPPGSTETSGPAGTSGSTETSGQAAGTRQETEVS